jgi:predicted outer membrane repeat protein
MGAAIYLDEEAEITLKNVSFSNNRVKTYGGALFADNDVQIVFKWSLFDWKHHRKDRQWSSAYLWGSESGLAIVTIVQINPAVPTEFIGNRGESSKL